MCKMLDKIMDLNPSTYDFIGANEKYQHYGFIAQEVKKVFPEFISHQEEDDLYMVSTS